MHRLILKLKILAHYFNYEIIIFSIIFSLFHLMSSKPQLKYFFIYIHTTYSYEV
jgi:hypothetical protein